MLVPTLSSDLPASFGLGWFGSSASRQTAYAVETASVTVLRALCPFFWLHLLNWYCNQTGERHFETSKFIPEHINQVGTSVNMKACWELDRAFNRSALEMLSRGRAFLDKHYIVQTGLGKNRSMNHGPGYVDILAFFFFFGYPTHELPSNKHARISQSCLGMTTVKAIHLFNV